MCLINNASEYSVGWGVQTVAQNNFSYAAVCFTCQYMKVISAALEWKVKQILKKICLLEFLYLSPYRYH